MIVFDRVCKRYQDNAYALNNINFKINDGDFVFLTGESGAGKSTIIKLLLRKYKATDGEIMWTDKIFPSSRTKIFLITADNLASSSKITSCCRNEQFRRISLLPWSSWMLKKNRLTKK